MESCILCLVDVGGLLRRRGFGVYYVYTYFFF